MNVNQKSVGRKHRTPPSDWTIREILSSRVKYMWVSGIENAVVVRLCVCVLIARIAFKSRAQIQHVLFQTHDVSFQIPSLYLARKKQQFNQFLGFSFSRAALPCNFTTSFPLLYILAQSIHIKIYCLLSMHLC